MSAQSAYNSTLDFIKDQCKQSAAFMNNVISGYKLNEHEATIYKLLIETDGNYSNNDDKNSNELIKMHHDINKKNANKQDIPQPPHRNSDCKQQSPQNEEEPPQTDAQQAPQNISWHWKLKALSCVNNPTDDPLSKCRRNVALMLNENIELENISEFRIKQIVFKLATIDHDIEIENNKLKLEYISKLLALNVTGDIQKAIGTPNITHKIDEMAFNFVKFEQQSKEVLGKLNEINCLINNSLIDLQLGILDNNKMKPVLAIQQYDILTDSIITNKQGTQLYDFTRNKKKQLNKIKQKWTSNAKIIKKKKQNKLYKKK
eukprot:327849_1